MSDRTEVARKRISMRDPLKRHIVQGRPSVRSVMAEALSGAGKLETIAVGACGPPGWVNEVRRVVTENIKCQGPSVSLFCEEFS
jgi:hypothetical protein